MSGVHRVLEGGNQANYKSTNIPIYNSLVPLDDWSYSRVSEKMGTANTAAVYVCDSFFFLFSNRDRLTFPEIAGSSLSAPWFSYVARD